MESDLARLDVYSGEGRIEKILARKGNVVMPAFEGILDGFMWDNQSEYANRSVIRPSSAVAGKVSSSLMARPGYRLTRTPPGSYYVGFTMYDREGEHQDVTLQVNEKEVGVALAERNDNRVHLYLTPEPLAMDGREQIRAKASGASGACRIENVVMLKQKPEPDRDVYVIRDVAHALLTPEPGREGLRAAVAWRTSWPCGADLEYGPNYEKRLRQGRRTECHRVFLTGLQVGDRIPYRVVAVTPAGETIRSPEGVLSVDLPGVEDQRRKGKAPLLFHRRGELSGAWPVSASVPFPKGRLMAEACVSVRDDAGAGVPIQTSTLARWEDGSVKVLLVDLIADAGVKGYVLHYGSDCRPDSIERGISAEEGEDRVRVDAGRVAFAVDRRTGDVLADLSIDGRPAALSGPVRAELVDAEGRAFVSGGPPDAVVVERTGPLHAVIRVEGPHRAEDGGRLFRAIFKVHAYAGQPFLRVEHIFENDRTEEEFTSIRSLYLTLPLREGATAVAMGEGPELNLKDGVALNQKFEDQYFVKAGERDVGSGTRAPGYALVRGAGGGLFAGVRHFYQNYPKSFEAGPGTLRLGICPALEGAPYDVDDEDLEVRLFFYLKGGRYKFRQGLSRRHDIVLHLAPGEVTADGLMRHVEAPPLLGPEPGWVCKSGAYDQFVPVSESPSPTWEAVAGLYYEGIVKARENRREYGMLNFGDWFGERVYNWGNNEYDNPYCYYVQYLRSGDARFHDLAEQALLHTMDVDTIRHTNRPNDLGGIYGHSMGHTGNYYPAGYKSPGYAVAGPTDATHSYSDGLMTHYLLTGDWRACQTACGVTDRLVRLEGAAYDFTNCRGPGWRLIMMMGTYRGTGDPYYLNMARIIVDRIAERQRPSGGWDRMLIPHHCLHAPPRHTGNCAFMVGIMLFGLRLFHQATGDRRLKKLMERGTDMVIRDMWDGKRKEFRYTSCPTRYSSPAIHPLVVSGMAYTYRLTRRKGVGRILRQAMDSCLKTVRPGMRGDGVSMQMRFVPMILSDLA